MSGNVRKKDKVINSLLEGSSITQASQVAGVTERTLHRWLKEPTFTAELRRRESMVFQVCGTRLVSLTSKALQALEGVLENPSKKGAGNLRLTAYSILTLAQTYREMGSFEERISALERKVQNDKK